LRKSLNKAASGDTVTWRRLSVHLDAVRVRDLPQPWSWIWVQATDASMLVRNHTKVPLRVELHRPGGAQPTPWADWPLFGRLMFFIGVLDNKDQAALITADVAPGIEWALRPKAREGRHFELKLLTEHGVVVCSKRLRRGQTFDFKVNVPTRKRPVALRSLQHRRAVSEDRKPSAKDIDCDDDQSVCSTAVPPSMSTVDHHPSFGSSSASTTSGSVAIHGFGSERQLLTSSRHPETPPMPALARPVAMRGISEVHSGGEADGIDAAICPRCLRETRARFTRPTAATYAEGVECDRCATKILKVEGASGPSESELPFFHCRRCWYDLCHGCAMREMQEVWWGEE